MFGVSNKYGTMVPMEEDTIQNELQKGPDIDTRHEPHEHAPRRLIIGIVALVLFLLIGGFVWAQWGEEIQETCFGDGEICTVELPDNL